VEKAIRQLSEALTLIVVSPQIHPAGVLAFWYAEAMKVSTDSACPWVVNLVLPDMVSAMLDPTSTVQKGRLSAAGQESDAETTGSTPFCRREFVWSHFETDKFIAFFSWMVVAVMDELTLSVTFGDRAKQHPANPRRENRKSPLDMFKQSVTTPLSFFFCPK
jgi:hypothetical protein